jgi:hypothetical protein
MRKKSRKKLRKQRLNKADKALTPALRHVAFTKYDYKAAVRQRMSQGTFGAASEVRIITDGDSRS